MPFYTLDERLGFGPGKLQPGFEDPTLRAAMTPEEPEGASFGEKFIAANKKHNPVFNIVKELVDKDVGDTAPIPGFNPLEHIEGYEQYAPEFVHAKNFQDIETIKLDIDYEKEQDAILNSGSGWTTGIAHLLAGAADPTILFPMAKIARTASAVGRFGTGVASGAGYGLAASGSREAVLQGVQRTRELDESAANILAESALGGLLGGFVGSMSSAGRAAGRVALAETLLGRESEFVLDESGNIARSVGSAEAPGQFQMEGLARISENFVKFASGGNAKFLMSPTVRGLTSASNSLKAITNKLFNHNFILEREVQGIARGDVAENLMRQSDAKLALLNEDINKLYMNHTGQGAFGSTFMRNEGKLSYTEFNERIAKGLMDSNYIDDIAEVKAATVRYRKALDEITEELKELKLIDKEVEGAYFPRVYDTKKLLRPAVREEFINVLTKRFITHDKDGNLRLQPIDEMDAKEGAIKAYNRITRMGDEGAELSNEIEGVISKGAFTKSRTLNMPDSLLENFLVKDAGFIVSQHIRKARALIEARKAFDSLGFKDLNAAKIQIGRDYDEAVKNAKSQKQRDKLGEKRHEDLKLVEDMMKLVTGNLAAPGSANRYTQTALKFNYLRLLGGVAISSIPEAIMPVFRFGLGRTFAGYGAMIRNFKTAKLAREQWQDIDVGIELLQNNILKTLSEPGELATKDASELELMWKGLFGEKVTDFTNLKGGITDMFGRATGLSYWTAFGRGFAGQLSYAETTRMLKKWATEGLSDKEIMKLANKGISTTDYKRVLSQIEKHGQELNGSYISNAHLWDDDVALKIIQRTVQNDVESTILKPGMGDIPLFAQSTAMGKLMFQFKSFMSAATNKVFLSGIQRRDANAMTGMLLLAGAGALTGIAKDKLAGREISDDPWEITFEGISRSGMLGLLATTPLDIGLNLYNKQTRRFGGSNVAGIVLGPTLGVPYTVGDMMSKAANGKVPTRQMTQMLPFNNVFYLQWAIQQAFGKPKD